jgi:hypothetical protein
MAFLPRTTQPPPAIPSMPDLNARLVQYLNTFALWCRNGFADKISATEAQPNLLLLASDDQSKVFKITVNAAGTISATAVPIGGPQ